MIGWSLLEGIGAALIMPAIVVLVAANFAPERRAAAYGLVAAAGAVAVAAGPLIGGAVTTFASWRYVFVAEVVIVIAILALLRKVTDVRPQQVKLDLVGSGLSVVGLGLVVFGVLRSAEWGWVRARPDTPHIFGTSPVIWMIVSGMLVVYCFALWETRLEASGGEPLVRLRLLRNRQLSGGLSMFFAQFLVQSGVFFAVPLFLSIVLGLSALQTGLRLLPLSVALLVMAAGVPRFAPRASPRRVVRLGLVSMTIGILVLVGGDGPGGQRRRRGDPDAAGGLGMGALASQLGAVTVSAVDDSFSAEVGGLQNTATNLAASLGVALIGSVLIATLTTAAASGIRDNPAIPASVKTEASTHLVGSVPFVSDPSSRRRSSRPARPSRWPPAWSTSTPRRGSTPCARRCPLRQC